jgi:hypothetical protein
MVICVFTVGLRSDLYKLYEVKRCTVPGARLEGAQRARQGASSALERRGRGQWGGRRLDARAVGGAHGGGRDRPGVRPRMFLFGLYLIGYPTLVLLRYSVLIRNRLIISLVPLVILLLTPQKQNADILQCSSRLGRGWTAG